MDTGSDGIDQAAQEAEAAAATSAIGNIADLGEHEVLLPAFIERRPEGLFVGVTAARFDTGFPAFVERVFAAGTYFVDLDYAAFQDLLFGEADEAGGTVRLASDIKPFPAARRALYRAVKLSPDRSVAEYMFEPVELQVEELVPLYGPAGADGVAEVVGQETVRYGVPTQLNFDEFVAAMWEKSVRFGIDTAAVSAALASGQVQRLEIARMQAPLPGQDASIEEKTEALHRDNAPRILPDGRMDLRQFKNRFPQIKADVRLLHKLPRQLGKAGHEITGALLEPALPKDFDFSALAGPGTRIENSAAGEFIVSARDGFLGIDTQTNQVSVTEKIVSREGVSMRTTGDVALTGDEFEEHGEVQERRVVEGRHMTFFSDVYGKIISRGGRILLKACIAGGQAISPEGSIIVMGRASRATLEARGGEIQVEFAEGCTIVGSRVKITKAVNCAILGEEVTIGISEGSAIAGKRVAIEQSTTRKDTETIVALLLPDFTRYDDAVKVLEEERQQAKKFVAIQDESLAQMLVDTGFKQYLALATTIAKGGAKLSAQHEANWRQAQKNFASQASNWQVMQQARTDALKKLAALDAEIADYAERKLRAGDGIACTIAHVRGDTLVRRRAFQPDKSVIGGSQAQEIAAHLREFGTSGDRLFMGSAGEFTWRPNQEPGAVSIIEDR
jgi:hypothetical protein